MFSNQKRITVQALCSAGAFITGDNVINHINAQFLKSRTLCGEYNLRYCADITCVMKISSHSYIVCVVCMFTGKAVLIRNTYT